MRPFAFLVTATCLATAFISIIVVTLASTREPVQPAMSLLMN